MNDTTRELAAPLSRTERPASRPERGLSAGVLFMLGSFFAHGVAYAALSRLPEPAHAQPLVHELAFTVLAPAEEPRAEAIPAPPPPVAPAPVVRRSFVQPTKTAPTPAPAVAPSAEPPPVQTLGTSTDNGLAVAGTVGAATPIAGTSLTGVQGGTGTGPVAAAPAPSERVDLGRMTRDWAAQVSQAIGARALREYPRSALRARVQGSVLLRVRIGVTGRIEAVELAQSSGHPQLDEAALSAARAVSDVPAPPAALHRYLRPFPVPVNYTIR